MYIINSLKLWKAQIKKKKNPSVVCTPAATVRSI